MGSNKARNMQVEGLRGFAAILVVIYHAFPRYASLFLDMPEQWAKHIGSIGAMLFLLISSYYMVDFNKKSEDFHAFAYFVQRFLRLWPTYAMAITFTFLLLRICYLPGRTTSLIDYFLNLCFLNGYIGTPYVDGAHWYMTTLVSITVMMGLAKSFHELDQRPLFYLAMACGIAVLSISGLEKIANIFAGGYFGYVCIAVSIRALIFYEKKNWKPRLVWFLVGIVGVGLIFVARGKSARIELLLIIPLFTLCVCQKMNVINNKLFKTVGKISFPLYLVHQNFIFVIEFYLTKFTGSYHVAWGAIAMAASLIPTMCLYWADQMVRKVVRAKR